MTMNESTGRKSYVVIGRDRRTGDVVDTLTWHGGDAFPSVGMADAVRTQKAAMTGPRITWTTEEV